MLFNSHYVSFAQVSDRQRPILLRYKRLAIERERELNAERQRKLNELRHYVEARLHQLEARACFVPSACKLFPQHLRQLLYVP